MAAMLSTLSGKRMHGLREAESPVRQDGFYVGGSLASRGGSPYGFASIQQLRIEVD